MASFTALRVVRKSKQVVAEVCYASLNRVLLVFTGVHRKWGTRWSVSKKICQSLHADSWTPYSTRVISFVKKCKKNVLYNLYRFVLARQGLPFTCAGSATSSSFTRPWRRALEMVARVVKWSDAWNEAEILTIGHKKKQIWFLDTSGCQVADFGQKAGGILKKKCLQQHTMDQLWDRPRKVLLIKQLCI